MTVDWEVPSPLQDQFTAAGSIQSISSSLVSALENAVLSIKSDLESVLINADADVTSKQVRWLLASISRHAEVSWSLDCDDGAAIDGGAPFEDTLQSTVGATCTLSMQDSFGDGWNGAEWTAEAGGSFYGPYSLPEGFSGIETFILYPTPLPPPLPPSPLSPPLALPPSPPSLPFPPTDA